ncbi:MAG: hypothetical protein R3C52_01120 [Hyphomonadaceae bacterium]
MASTANTGRTWSRRSWLAGGAALAAAGCASAGGSKRGRKPVALTPMLYYLGAAKVFALNPEGGAPVVLHDATPTDGSRPRGVNDGIAIDLDGGHIYWTNMGRAEDRDGSIHRCNLDGGEPTVIVPPGAGAWTPKQLKLDAAHGKLWWADREGMAIMRCNLDGSKIEAMIRIGDPVTYKGDETLWCVGIALDPARGQIYWTQKGGDNAGQGRIRRAAMEVPRGSHPSRRDDIETLFARLPEPIDLDLDLTTRRMYWTDRGDDTVNRAPMDAGDDYDPARRADREVLVTGVRDAIGVSLDLKRGRMAYTSLHGEVGVSGLDGGGATMLASGQGLLTGVTWLG